MVKQIASRKLEADRPQGRGGGRRPDRPHRGLLSRASWDTRSPSSTKRRRRAACCALRFRNTGCPRPCLRREIELIERMGVKFTFNTRIGLDLPLNELADRFDAVFISIGTWKESWLYLPGTEFKGVHHALQLLEEMSRSTGDTDRAQGGHHRRRQRRHRLGALGVAHGRGRNRLLPSRTQGHAGHRRRDGWRRKKKERVCVSGRAAPHHGRPGRQRTGHRDRKNPAR